MPDSDYFEDWDDHAYFEGPCTCTHDEDAHGWGVCGVALTGRDCPCEAGWTE